MNLTDKQISHRQYLGSPIWASKRSNALAFYGCICNRCGRWGNDVHHKTYERVGGNELMEDLEVLCRDCHETHHRVERATRKPVCRRKNTGISRTALVNYLTTAHRQLLKTSFSLSWNEIYIAIIEGSNQRLTNEALRLIGKKYAVRSRSHINREKMTTFSKRHHAKLLG